MGGYRLHADLRRADAGVRSRRRHAGLSAHFPRRQPVECRRIRAVRAGAKLRRVAGRARAAGRGRGTGAELWAGAGDQPASGVVAHAGPRRLYHGDRHRRRAGSVDRRPAGAADRLARGVLVPRAACIVGVPAGLAVARRCARPRTASASTPRAALCWCWRSARCCWRSTSCSTFASARRDLPLRRLRACSRLAASSCGNAARSGRSSTCVSSATSISRC